jgi:hypothetical protein
MIIEHDKKLSESILWQLQRKAYCDFGPKSWIEKGVPFQVTNSAYIAKGYAEIAKSAIERSSGPFYFLELGAGSGKFAYLFLKELLLQLKDRTSFCYILSDIAEKNIAYWKSHPLLQPFIEKGVLDIAEYDPLKSKELFLQKKGITLEKTPFLFVIANYFFDSIEQDLFRVEEGQFFEGRISLKSPLKIEDPHLISTLSESYDFKASKESLPLAEEYLQLEKTTFLYPTGAMQTIEKLSHLSEDLTLLIGDKGPCDLKKCELPKLHLHGTFSFPINFHLLSRYVQEKGGRIFLPEKPTENFNVALFRFGKNEVSHSISLNPQTLFDEIGGKKSKTFSEFLSLLEKSHYDASLFFSLLDQIEALLPDCSKKEKLSLIAAIAKVRNHFFPLSQEESLLLVRLSSLLEKLGQASEELFKEIDRFKNLPKREAFYDIASVCDFIRTRSKDALLISEGLNLSPQGYTLATPQEIQNLGKFDTIFFIAPLNLSKAAARTTPLIVQEGEKKIKEIEEKLPELKTMAYTDQDLDAFLSSLTHAAIIDPKYLLNFLTDLAKKGQIDQPRLEKAFKRAVELGFISKIPPLCEEIDEAPREFDLFFETLRKCLKVHMKKGACFHAYLFDTTSKFEEEEFVREIITNPFLDYNEEIDELTNTLRIKVRLNL